jgi:hypothetical protein
MTYLLFKKLIQTDLRKRKLGKTWKELKADLALPYDRPCPEWTKRLEREISLTRQKGQGRELVWTIKKKR